ncbi:MAG: hypothetical protein KFF73_06015 [Cyclobacteriaceae bacterium]|nr:hypothetical protein [Cyclobacteriaceae bacterium]
MFKSREILDRCPDLKFYKLVCLGGGNGYSLKTSFDSYSIFTVWDHPQHADHFFNSSFFGEFVNRSHEQYTIVMKPIISRESWSGFNEWKLSGMDADNSLICVLTRATVKVKFFIHFSRCSGR